jgi:homoserine O-succinyltransferase
MPLIIDGGRVPARWQEKKNCRPGGPSESPANGAESISIAFINNMPDTALEDTEMQFFELLEAAAGDVSVRVKLHSLSGVPRGERGLEHLNNFYSSSDDLFEQQFDGMKEL